MSHHYLETYHGLIRWIADHVIIFAFCILAFQYCFPYKPMEVIGKPRVINPERVVPGSIIWTETRYNKYLPYAASITKSLVCAPGQSIFISKEGGNNQVGIDRVTASPLVIPELNPVEWQRIRDLSGGAKHCVVRITWDYDIGFFHQPPIVAETEPFPVQ
jgi:hypothetical protein